MAINIKFDTAGNPEPPSIILATKNGNKLGLLNVNADSIELNDKLKISEISFTLNKYVDGELNNLWDKVVDFKLVWCKEWDCWFEIKVELDEATETVKTVFGTQLGQAELSQIMVYNMEVNTEEDIARDDYKITILYDENDHKASLLHRIFKDKAPHYSIAYVDPTIARIQRQFSWDGSSICDVLDEIEEEIGCLVVYNSNSTEGGRPNRSISVYDLEQNCSDCGHRGEFIDKCPKCGSKNIKYGYGEDTTIFVTADELASDGIELVTDTDSVKNCFKLEAGDDLMTATIRNCNPNGSDYIWRFSNDIKSDMSVELIEKLESYDAEYKRYYNEHESNLDTTLLTQYNNLVEKYDDFYNTDSTCLNCDNKGRFYNKCPNCNSENLLTGKELQKISTPIIGYPSLMNAYYNTIDFALYLESSLMPNVEMSETNAIEQLQLLVDYFADPDNAVAVNVKEISSISSTTADSAVLSMAKVIVKSTYKVEILSSSLSTEKKWSGTFKITNYSDDTDTAEVVVNDIEVNNDAETFIKQKIEKALNKENTDDYSISGLFEKEYNEFCTELTKYALNPLQSFYDAADACISILTEQGAGDETNKPDLYENLYLPYFQKQDAIASEINIRKNELAIIEGVYDETVQTASGGLQNDIRNCQNVIQNALNFEDYLGEDLWKEFCSFRREDKYSNSNYISDGLNNAQLFEKALEFIDVAENEIYKSSELQHSISTSLNNLLAIDKFKPLVKYFKNGNWIRVRVDDKIYKLRLLEYDINFGSFESIPVEFSDVIKIKNSTTDVKDVLEQASSVASSYDAVTRQAKKGNVAKSTIEQWLDEGLNAANVQIQSNDSEEIIITKSGLLGRSYDDITGTYSPEQLKITHNIMAYTDDNWETVKQAIGKHSYSAYDEGLGKIVDDKIGYGMSAEFVTAGVVSGSQIIGGDIYSDNYSITDRTGSYLNLRDGTFNFGGGALRFEGGELLISSPNVVTKNEVTAINEEYLKTTSVYAENLRVKAANIQEQLTAKQINTEGLIAENISATVIEGKTIEGGSLSIGNKSTDSYAEIDTNGKLTCMGADITGAINATGGSFVDGTFDNCTINENCTIKGKLDGVDGTFSGDIVGATITGGSLSIGNSESEYSAEISEDGILHAQGAVIEGDINATSGTIGGCEIVDGKLTADNLSSISADLGEVTAGVIKSKNYSSVENGIEVRDGTATYSEGLKYTLSTTEEYYIVSGIGTCTDANLIIPSIYNGLPVKQIDTSAFYQNTNIVSVEIPEGVYYIKNQAFSGCTNLISIVIPSTITRIGENAFNGCSNIEKVYISSLENWCNINFSAGGNGGTNPMCSSSKAYLYLNGQLLEKLVIPFGTTNISSYAFYNHKKIKNVEFPNSIIRIEKSAFAFCSNLESVVIPNSVEYIGYDAFYMCSGLTSITIGKMVSQIGSTAFLLNASNTINPPIYYYGTEYDWSSIDFISSTGANVDRSNVKMLVFPIYYYDTTNIKDGCWNYQSTNGIKISLDDATIDSQYFKLTSDGRIFATNATIEGNIVANSINVQHTQEYNQIGYIINSNTQNGGFASICRAIGERNPVGSGYMVADNTGLVISCEKGTGRLEGVWSADTCLATTSDRELKHDIEVLNDNYSSLFDILNPVRFKYNDGASDRYHVGFIYQDVEQAILNAGLSLQEFAATITIGDHGALRYEEFVALCVNEIQKLKRRVAELENQ